LRVSGALGRRRDPRDRCRQELEHLKIVALLCLLAAGNLAFHIEAHVQGLALYSTRLGIMTVVMLIMVIGGLIIPSFTLNWLMRQAPDRLPVPFGRFDVACVVLSGASLALWVVEPATKPLERR
jgi:uncharacterized protein involved in response to NO